MDTIIAAIISGIGVISATIIAAVISYYTSKKLNVKQNKASQDIEILKHQLERSREAETKSEQLQSIMKRYRDPLLRSAFELQSRFFNILKQNLLWVYLINGTTQEREYTIQSTLFVIAQYFGWIEILRRDIQFLDLGNVKENRELSKLLESISGLFLTDYYGSEFRIFRIEQRAIGELMINQKDNKLDCIGYHDFVENLQKPEFYKWFKKIENDIKKLSESNGANETRLYHIQHSLIDLMEFLDDKKHPQIPPEVRTKA